MTGFSSTASSSTAFAAEPMTRQFRHEESARLLQRAHETDDPRERADCLEQVILLNRGVAEAVANRYRGRGIPQDDLQQAAYEGLVKAVSRFDPTMRKDLLTFAVPTIRGEVQRYFRDHGWVVRPPRRIQDMQWRIGQAVDDLSGRLGREPTTAEIAELLDVDEKEIGEAWEAQGCFRPTSLDTPLGAESDTARGDLIGEDDLALDAAEARVVLRPAVRKLSERDRRILSMRFLEDRTQQEIGDEIGVTQMQVSRLLSRILRDLRRDIAGAA